MAGVRVTITYNDNGTPGRLREFAARLRNTRPLMQAIGDIAKESVTENFETGGRPRWKPLAPGTVKAKGHTKPLIGKSRNLRNIVLKVTEKSAIVGVQPATKAYAAIHHFGGRAGRGRKVTIPARPYLLLQPEDLREVEQVLESWPREALGEK